MKLLKFLQIALLAFTFYSIPSASYAQATTTSYNVVRLNNGQPIIDQDMFADLGVNSEGDNINGPSLIRIPDWIPASERADPSAVYYLYFAHHTGDYIRLAWASNLTGPWRLHDTGSNVRVGDRGVLDNGGRDINVGRGIVIEENHIASPDVHVDNENRRIIMYFHSGSSTTFNGDEVAGQVSWVSTSSDGLDFNGNIEPAFFGASYFRVFAHGGDLYAFDNSGVPRRALNANDPWTAPSNYYSEANIGRLWELHPNDFIGDAIEDETGYVRSELRVRHTAVHIVGDELQVFYSQRGEDAPERIMLSTIDLGVNSWEDWEFSYPPVTLLQAASGWEGGQFTPRPSEAGAASGDVNELRDPYVFEDDDGSLYLIYAGRGESGLGIASLSSGSTGGGGGGGQQSMTTLTPTDDSYVRDGESDNQNFGRDSELRIKNHNNANFDRKSYVKFDLRGIFDVEEAIVRLRADNVHETRITVHESSHNWAENSVTWDNVQPEGDAIATINIGADNQWYEWNVTDYVRENENQPISFVFYGETTGSNSILRFSSKEGNNAPELRILTRD